MYKLGSYSSRMLVGGVIRRGFSSSASGAAAASAKAGWWKSTGSKIAVSVGVVGVSGATYYAWNQKQNGVDALLFGSTDNIPDHKLPIIQHPLVFAPNVPPPVKRNHRARVKIDMSTTIDILKISGNHFYEYWTFDGHIPGPFIRARVGDILDVSFTNKDMTGMNHNIDFHAITGPGGGAGVLTSESGQTTRGAFKLLFPGLFVYHCAVGPVGVHVAQGMYGLILVEPKEPLPVVNHEFYVMQHEIYCEDPETAYQSDEPQPKKTGGHGHGGGSKNPDPNPGPGTAAKIADIVPLEFSFEDCMNEKPRYVLFNGSEESLKGKNTLQVKQGDRVRIYFGNAGPNLVSSFHIIGAIFDKVYREADLTTPPARGVQTTLVPAGGATVVEFDAMVPGTYTLVDHSIIRVEKGCVGFVNVTGPDRLDIFNPYEAGIQCENCKHHP